MKSGFWSAIILLTLLAMPAFAGTTTLAFSCDGTGPLNYQALGPGTLNAVNGRASFNGANRTLIAQSGSPVLCSGVVTVSMTLQPYADAANGAGIILIDPQGEDPLTATVYPDGTVRLIGYMGFEASTHFTYPAAGNNVLTLTYDSVSDTATVTVTATPPQTRSVSLDNALMGGGSVQVGVFSGGPGGFSSFSASGSQIPNYTSPVFGIVAYPGVGMKEIYEPLHLQVQVKPGSTNVTYQWYKDGILLDGETAATYDVASLLPGNAGSYMCKVTDGCGIVHDTPPAVVTLLPENSLPAGGIPGYGLLAALTAFTGALVLRRRLS